MKTKTAYILVTLIALTVLGGGTAFAQRSFISVLDRIEGINLTGEQREKLETTELAHHKKMIRFRADLAIAKLEKHTLLKKKDFKKETVQEQIKKIMAVKTDMQMERLENHDLLRRVLTDDQWKLFKEERNKKEGRRMGKNRRGMGPHHGREMRGCGFGGPGMGMDE